MWVFGIGIILMYIGLRVVVPFWYKVGFSMAGLTCFILRSWSNKPTLTIYTSSNEYALLGNDATLQRLSMMINMVQNGQTIPEARSCLEALERGIPFENIPIATEPQPLLPSASIDQFLGESDHVDRELNEGIDLDWMPTHAPQPQPSAPHFSTLPPGYWTQPSPSHMYPIDHRPAPTQYPVLTPIPTTPPMHQQDHAPTINGFFPSFWGPEGAHIPTHQGTTEQQNDTPELDLDLELDAQLLPQSEPSDGEVIEPHLQPQNKMTQHRLQPKSTSHDHRSPFTRRQQRLIRTHQAESTPSPISRLRTAAHHVFARIRNQRPAVVPRTETASFMREQAQTNQPPNQAASLFENLSEQQGGVLPEATTLRLQRRAEAIQLQSSEHPPTPLSLENLSFSDFESTQDDAVELTELDD